MIPFLKNIPANIRLLFTISFSLCCIAITPSIVSAKTITIPGDANSIQQAVDLAASGDEILLATDFVDWNIVIYKLNNVEYELQDSVIISNKDLLIKGCLIDKKTTIGRDILGLLEINNRTLRVIDSNITFENCIIKPIVSNDMPPVGFDGPMPSPIEIESGTLVLKKCNYTTQIIQNGNLILIDCEIENWAYRYSASGRQFKIGLPAIDIKNSIVSSLKILNSTVFSNNSVSINNIQIINSTNTSIHIEHSNLFGGTGSTGGTEGLLIDNCDNFSLFMNNSKFIGSQAEKISPQRYGGFQNGGNGGNGLTISNSKGMIISGDEFNFLNGNDGANGIIEYDSIDWQLVEINGANGGHGLAIFNSTVQVNFTSFEDAFIASGGKGGEGAEYDGRVALPGKDGLPIFIDENSTIIYPTQINDWMFY